MLSINFFITITSILTALYAIPYANWEFKNSNKPGSILIYIFVLLSFSTSIYNLFS
ncbi:MAG: hypothetical protein IKK43_01995 [Clostridia bacterium]|nr:hypothetical protein [Clostridia bacterium]